MYERTPGYWILFSLGILLFVVFCPIAGIFIIWKSVPVWDQVFRGIPILVYTIVGLVMVCAPISILKNTLVDTIKYFDIDNAIKIAFLDGKVVGVAGVRALSLRSKTRNGSLIITDEGGEKKIDSPFMFKNYKEMFAALEKASGVKLLGSDGTPYFK